MKAFAALLAAAAVLLPAADGRAEERIERFDVRVVVEEDASFDVTETIAYDFGGAERHGIYRDIPVRYSRRGAPDHGIVLDVLEVRDGNGLPIPYRVSSTSAARRIRIGDANKTVRGRHTYRIHYRARLAMLHFDAHDEVYWNATGHGWRVPIDAASVHVALRNVPNAVDDVACFTGPMGSTRTACEALREPDGARFRTRAGLAPGEGLTVVVALPKGHVREPSDADRWLARLAPFLSGWLALPFAALFGLYGHWRRNGRDPAPGAAVPVRYEPPAGLEPAEVGTLLDETADLNDVTATILQLAVLGHIEIHEQEATRFLFFERKDYELVKREGGGALKPYQTKLLSALFDGRDRVLVSDLKNEFYRELPAIREALYEGLSGRGAHFAASPDSVRTRWRIGGGLVFGIGVFAIAMLGAAGGAYIAATGVVLFLFANAMPRRTRKGRRAYEEILGLREFMERVDRDRLARMGVDTREQFESLLPYAIVLGTADAWADAFAEIYTEPPTWYHGYDGLDGFRAHRFVSDVGRGLDTIGQALTSQPSSGGSGSSGFGGGGFSGGGFGGGGGGSW